MSNWAAVAGAAFWMEVGPAWHPCFVLNNPIALANYGRNSVLVVNASTPGRYVDPTCMLPGECHASIKHESFIYYAKAHILQAPDLEKNVAARNYRAGTAADIKLIKKIVAHMHEADELDDEFKPIALLIEEQLNQLK